MTSKNDFDLNKWCQNWCTHFETCIFVQCIIQNFNTVMEHSDWSIYSHHFRILLTVELGLNNDIAIEIDYKFQYRYRCPVSISKFLIRKEHVPEFNIYRLSYGWWLDMSFITSDLVISWTSERSKWANDINRSWVIKLI